MRNQTVLDLHDYYDLHRNRRAAFERLQTEIFAGRYRPGIPLVVRLEKRDGLTRRLCIPQVIDAVVLQALVEYIYPKIREKQPSENAFFSRSHSFNRRSFEAAEDGYGWFVRWRAFSAKRDELPRDYKFLAITDIANYYENVQHANLRNILSSIFLCEEVLLDFLFMILDGLSWRPDYLPPSGRGLPQVDFDAPRLLAHAFLFEADAYLKEETDDRFLRWVDDINVPADTELVAASILHGLDNILMTRGLRLNSGKTAILSAEAANLYLQKDENAFIDRWSRKAEVARKEGRALSHVERNEIRLRFASFIRANNYGM